jgi:hypothetical protein
MQFLICLFFVAFSLIFIFMCACLVFSLSLLSVEDGNLQRLQTMVLRTTGNFPMRTLVRDMHVDFQVPYFYDYITKLCRRKTEIVQNHVRNIAQGETSHTKYKRLKLGGGHVYDRSRVYVVAT